MVVASAIRRYSMRPERNRGASLSASFAKDLDRPVDCPRAGSAATVSSRTDPLTPCPTQKGSARMKGRTPVRLIGASTAATIVLAGVLLAATRAPAAQRATPEAMPTPRGIPDAQLPRATLAAFRSRIQHI